MGGRARAAGSIAYRAIGVTGEGLETYVPTRLERRDPAWASRPGASPDDPKWLIETLARGFPDLVPELPPGQAAGLRSCAFELLDVRNKSSHFDLVEGARLAMRAVDRARVLLAGLGLLTKPLEDELTRLEAEAAGLLRSVSSAPRSLEELRSGYIENLLGETRHDDLRGLLPLRKPESPSSVYVPPRLVEYSARRPALPQGSRADPLPEDDPVWPSPVGEQVVMQSKLASYGLGGGPAQPWASSLSATRCVVLGGPGSGKTSLFRHIAREVALGSPGVTPGSLPILVSARQLVDGTGNARDLERYLIHDHIPPFAEVVQHALRSDRFLLLVDSLDEAGGDRARRNAADAIARFARLHPGARVFVSSRPAGYETWGLSAEFECWYLEPFGLEEVRSYVTRWLADVLPPSDSDVDAVLEEMAAARVVPLTATPLLLALLMLARSVEGSLPRKRVALYDLAVEVLAERWPARRGTEVDRDEVLDALRPIATGAALQDGRVAHVELVAALATVRVAKGTPRTDARRWAERLLRLIEDDTGLVTQVGLEDGEPQWEFLHRTIAEHLAGRDVADRWLAGEQPIAQLFGDPSMREVLTFAMSHLDHDDPTLAARAVEEVVEASDPLERHVGRRARWALSLVADFDLRLTEAVRERLLATVRRIGTNQGSPARTSALALLARYAVATGDDPWESATPASREPVSSAVAIAAWSTRPRDVGRVAGLAKALDGRPSDEVGLQTAGEVVNGILEGLDRREAMDEARVVVGSAAWAPISEETRVAFAQAGIPAFTVSRVPDVCDNGDLPALWICEIGAMSPMEYLRLYCHRLPDSLLADVYMRGDRSAWEHLSDDDRHEIRSFAEAHPRAYLDADRIMDECDFGDEPYDEVWWSALVSAASQQHDRVAARRARRALVGHLGTGLALDPLADVSTAMRLVACDACHRTLGEVERDRAVRGALEEGDVDDSLSPAPDGALAGALRHWLEHESPAIRGSAARALLGIFDSYRETSLREFVRERAFGEPLVADLEGHVRRDPKVLHALLARFLALSEAVTGTDWDLAVTRLLQQVLGLAVIEADWHDHFFLGARAPSRPSPSAIGLVVGLLREGGAPAATLAARALALTERTTSLGSELAALIERGDPPAATAAAAALRAVDFDDASRQLDALVAALPGATVALAENLGEAYRRHAPAATRRQAAELVGLALDDTPETPALHVLANWLT